MRDAPAGLGKVKAADGRITGSFAKPIGPVRLTLVLGATQQDGGAGRCGTHTFGALDCTPSATGTKVTCE